MIHCIKTLEKYLDMPNINSCVNVENCVFFNKLIKRSPDEMQVVAWKDLQQKSETDIFTTA